MPNSAKETILLIHGTFAAPKEGTVKWYMPGSDFCRQLDGKLEGFGSCARTWAHLEDPDRSYFFWDGRNTWQSRIKAAEDLAAEIRDLMSSGWRCHLVAHSHGGTATIDAIESLGFDADSYDGNVVLMGTPVYTRNQTRLPFLSLMGALGLVFSLLTWIAVAFLIGDAFSYNSVQVLPDSSWVIWGFGILTTVLVIIRLFFFFLRQQFGAWDFHDGPGGVHIPKMPKLVCMSSKKDEVYRLFTEIVDGPNPLISRPVGDPENSRDRFGSTGTLKRVVQDSLKADSVRFPGTLSSMIIRIPLVGLGLISLLLGFSTLVGENDPQSLAWIEAAKWVSIIAEFLLGWLIVVSVLSPGTLRDHLLLPWRFISIVGLSVSSIVRMMAARPLAILAWSTVRAWTMGLAGGPHSAAHTQVSVRPQNIGNCAVMPLPDAVVAETLARQDDSAKETVEAIIDNLSESKDWGPTTISELFMKTSVPGVHLVHSAYYEHTDSIDLIAVWLSVDDAIRASMNKIMENTRLIHNQEMSADTAVKNIRHMLAQRSK